MILAEINLIYVPESHVVVFPSLSVGYFFLNIGF